MLGGGIRTIPEFKRRLPWEVRFSVRYGLRDSSRADILAAFADRLENDINTEFETALAEIHKIATLRLRALEAEQ